MVQPNFAARPLTSGMMRVLIGAGAGMALSIGVPVGLDHFTKPPDAHGRSPHRIDSNEMRGWLSGSTSAIIPPTVLGAGLVIGVLYTSHKMHTPDREIGLLRMAYGAVGGTIVGTMLAGGFMKPKVVQAPVTGDDPYVVPPDVIVTK